MRSANFSEFRQTMLQEFSAAPWNEQTRDAVIRRARELLGLTPEDNVTILPQKLNGVLVVDVAVPSHDKELYEKLKKIGGQNAT